MNDIESISKTRKLVFLSLLAASALILGYIETLIPLPSPVPYIKPGLGNVVVIVALYVFGAKEALTISLIKIIMSSLLYSGAAALPYSLSGGLLSFSVMLLLKKCSIFGVIGVSAAGGAFHMLGQIIAAALIIENISISFFMAPLLLTGGAAGVFVGLVSGIIIGRVGEFINHIN